MSSKYIRPGSLDGVVGYAYNPATLPNGAQTYTTSTGQMQVVYDENFSSGQVGHDASYMRVVEAYKLKKQIRPGGVQRPCTLPDGLELDKRSA